MRKSLLKQALDTRWDDWVPQDRLRKFNDENKELAANLRNAMEANRAQTRPSKSGPTSHKKKLPSEVGSMRGSEERTTAARGQKRGRDFDLEKVSLFLIKTTCEHSIL